MTSQKKLGACSHENLCVALQVMSETECMDTGDRDNIKTSKPSKSLKQELEKYIPSEIPSAICKQEIDAQAQYRVS